MLPRSLDTLKPVRPGTLPRIGRLAASAVRRRFAEEAAEFNEDRAVTKIEARNVVNGLALLEHIKETNKPSYPFGFEIGTGADKLLQPTEPQRVAIDAEVQRLMLRDAWLGLALTNVTPAGRVSVSTTLLPSAGPALAMVRV